MKIGILALLRFLAVPSLLVALAPPWPQDTSDLKADSKATYGRLENGLRYIILPNEEPPGRASLRLIPPPLSRRAAATSNLAARIAGNNPPTTPMSRAQSSPPMSSVGVTAKAKATWLKLCQLSVAAR